MDSGASHHLTGQLEGLFITNNHQTLPVKVADGRTVVAKAKGRLNVQAMVDDGRGNSIRRDFVVDNVYYVPGFQSTLLSVSTLVKAGHSVDFPSLAALCTTVTAVELVVWLAYSTVCIR